MKWPGRDYIIHTGLQISSINAYVRNLEKWNRWTYFQDRIRDADVENRPVDTEGKGEGGMSWETDMYILLLLLLLLRHFSRVQLCATLWTAAHQAPPSLGFSRQEHWSGLPFPSPMHEKWKWRPSVVSDSSDPMDCSLPGSSIHRIFQARVME